jgi:hypothetical protein
MVPRLDGSKIGAKGILAVRMTAAHLDQARKLVGEEKH